MSGAEILAVVACVAAVVSAYHDGSGLIRKIKERRRTRRALREAETKQLENSLELGPVVVQGQYDHDYRRFGDIYARGDPIAREQMKDVLITLQLAVLHNLRGIWDTDADIDYAALQDASDASRVDSVVCLGQLYQRLAQASPPTRMQLPMSYPQYPTYMQHMGALQGFIGHAIPPSQQYEMPMSPPRSERSSASSAALTPEIMTAQMTGLNLNLQQSRQPTQPAQHTDDTSRGTSKTSSPALNPFRKKTSSRSEGPSPVPGQYRRPSGLSGSPKEHGIEEIEPLFSNRQNRQPSQSNVFVDHPQTPEPDRLSSSSGMTQLSSTSSRERYNPDDYDHIYINPWHSDEKSTGSSNLTPPRPVSSRGLPPNATNIPMPTYSPFPSAPEAGSQSISAQTIPPAPGIVRARTTFLAFPSESNSYLGFCKGAWRLQVGDDKKAFNVEQRPVGMTMTLPFWRCSKCDFEGPLLGGSAKSTRRFDTNVRRSNGGIQYRWAFLAKSHIENKKGIPREVRNGSFGTFGCLFCSAEGLLVSDNMSIHSSGSGSGSGSSSTTPQHHHPRSRWKPGGSGGSKNQDQLNATTSTTPVFGNVTSLMDHLEEHRREGREPSSGLLERTKCIIGRVAEAHEEFDINLPSLKVQEIA